MFLVEKNKIHYLILTSLFCFLLFNVKHINAQTVQPVVVSENSFSEDEDEDVNLEGKPDLLLEGQDERLRDAQRRLRKTRETLSKIEGLIEKNSDNRDLQDAIQKLKSKEISILQEMDAIRMEKIKEMEIKEQDRLAEEEVMKNLDLVSKRTLREAYDTRLMLIKKAVKQLKNSNIKEIRRRMQEIEEVRLKQKEEINEDLKKAMESKSVEAAYDLRDLKHKLKKLNKFSLNSVRKEVDKIEEELDLIEELRSKKSTELKNNVNNNDILVDNLGLKRMENNLRRMKRRIDKIEEKLQMR